MKNKGCKGKSSGKISIILSVLATIGVCIIIFGTPLFHIFKDEMFRASPYSLTLWLIIFGFSAIIIFCIFRRTRIYKFDENGKISTENAELYYNHGMNNIRSVIAIYVVAITLLWGFSISNNSIGYNEKLLEYELQYDLNYTGNDSWVKDKLIQIEIYKGNYSDILKQQGTIISMVFWSSIFVYYCSLIEDFSDILKKREKIKK